MDVNVHLIRATVGLLLGDEAAFTRERDAALVSIGVQLANIPPGASFDTTGVRGAFTAFGDAQAMRFNGDPAQAYRTLSEALEAAHENLDLQGPLGELAVEAEQWRDAIRILEGSSRDDDVRSEAKFYLGKAYEAIGENEKALDAYRTFLSRWEMADPGLTWLREAQEAVDRLGG
jgi:tetratricopeptide (TPR) repeat protein